MTKELSSSKRHSDKPAEWGLKKVPKFETSKAKGDDASLWIKRLELGAQEESWFDTDMNFASRLMTVVDNQVLR